MLSPVESMISLIVPLGVILKTLALPLPATHTVAVSVDDLSNRSVRCDLESTVGRRIHHVGIASPVYCDAGCSVAGIAHAVTGGVDDLGDRPCRCKMR